MDAFNQGYEAFYKSALCINPYDTRDGDADKAYDWESGWLAAWSDYIDHNYTPFHLMSW